ncbi:MAG: branched-chain amino acid ABC transporter permease [Desulfobacteraceae bacterium]|nr:branched-chain amino acid ABC transporter permease [Desulfobacteraceae bacterium]MBC2754497.1 branched-chain amino acid ABC transporter permease [Desulfobacteraceae bacterium]
MKGKNSAGFLALIISIISIPFMVTNDYYLGVLIFTAFNCLACIGLCLLMGYAGQISIGHGAFIAIGAYTSGILTAKFAWSPWLAMLCGVLIVIVIAFCLGIPALRLKGHYLAMATLGFASIVHIVAVAAVDLTGGPSGIVNIPRLDLFGYVLSSDKQYFYFSWSVVALSIYIAFNLINSRVGRGLQAIHGSEDAASSLGINITSYKVQVFILSAVFASISGSLYAYYMNYIDPGPFDVMHSVLLVTMVAVGGLHNIWGALIGAIFLSLLPEFLSFLSDYLQVLGIEYQPDYDTLVYGGILLIIMLFLPEGIFNGLSSIIQFIRSSFRKFSGRAAGRVE